MYVFIYIFYLSFHVFDSLKRKPSVYMTISDWQYNTTESQEMSSCKGNSASVLGLGLLFLSHSQI